MVTIRYELKHNGKIINARTQLDVDGLPEADGKYRELRDEIDTKVKPGESYNLDKEGLSR